MHTNMRPINRSLACLGAVITLAKPVLAATYWQNTGTGSWFLPANWVGGVVPAGYSDSGWVRNGGTAVIDGPGATPTSIVAGDVGDGTVILAAGGSAVLSVDLAIAHKLDYTGNFRSEGGSLSCRNIMLGNFGDGTLTMTGGTMISTWHQDTPALSMAHNIGSRGTLDISGGRLQVNRNALISLGTGTRSDIMLSGSGELVVSNILNIASGARSLANLTQTGGTLWTTFLSCGGNGSGMNNATGTMNFAGGTLSSTTLTMGIASGSVSRVVFAGTHDATIRSAGRVVVGQIGTSQSTLSVSNNASLTLASDLFVAGFEAPVSSSTVTGILNVAGGEVSAVDKTFNVGNNGYGRMNMDGGSVTLWRTRLGVLAGSRGELYMRGGTLTGDFLSLALASGASGHVVQSGGFVNVGYLNIGGHAAVGPADASYTLTGGVLRCLSFSRTAGGTGQAYLGGGTLSADLVNSAYGSLTNNGATIAPAYDQIGKTQIQSGDYIETSPNCAVAVQIGGATQGTQYDWVQVNKKISLAGNLRVSFTNGFDATVAATDKFYVMASDAATPIEGAFANAAPGERVETDEGHSFAVYYGGNHAGNGADRVTLTGFKQRPRGTVITLR